MYFKLLSAAFFFSKALTHTWNEQLIIIKNGIFIGSNSYPRGYISRSESGFNNNMMTYLLPLLALERIKVNNLNFLCAPTQRTINQTANFPRLQILPESFVAMKYLENSYVTLL